MHKGEITFDSRRGPVHVWGGAITENIVQALAKIVIQMVELRLARKGLHSALQVHDELIYAVRDYHVDAVCNALGISMRAPVPFMVNLPVECEIAVGDNYAEAK